MERIAEASPRSQARIAGVFYVLTFLSGGFALFGFLRRRKQGPVEALDPRADELRRKLAESRSIVEERDEFEAAELTVDLAEPAPEDPESRRRHVHEAGRAAVDQMRERR